jgi:hypothetical protein
MGLHKNSMTGIADLLPEGLDEGTLEKIANLLAKKIDEEVKVKISDLNTKVVSFIKGQIGKLKEQAIKELELENETFRNAQLYETMRSMFALENTADDEITGAGILASIGEAQEVKINTLVSELDKLLNENKRLRTAQKTLTSQNEQLKESVTKLVESAKLATEKGNQKRMSDSAIVVSEQNFKIRENKKDEKQVQKATNGNEWLTESVVDAAKKLNVRG